MPTTSTPAPDPSTLPAIVRWQDAHAAFMARPTLENMQAEIAASAAVGAAWRGQQRED